MRLEYFDMLDRLVALDREARRIHLAARLPADGPVFEGHFPGHPILPGVLQIEIIAQAAGVLSACLSDDGRMPVLMAVDAARFRSFVRPEAELDIRVEIALAGSDYVAATGSVRSGGRRVCEAEVRLRLMPEAAALRPFLDRKLQKLGLCAPTLEGTA